MVNYYCEEGCGIPTASTCKKWRECYKSHSKETIKMIEREIKRKEAKNGK